MRIKRISILLGGVFLLAASLLHGQEYFVYFTDKGENIRMLNNPYSFLSPKAVENRALRQVAIEETDLPVASSYTEALRQRGFQIKMTSRWFNFAVVDGKSAVLNLQDLSFVKKVEQVERYQVSFAGKTMQEEEELSYGLAEHQITMVEGDHLHANGYLGQGMTIAVLDGGFHGTPSISGLDSLWQNGQILGSYNFVNGDTNVFDIGSHGTKVLSIMGGYLGDEYAGTAVKANYWLLKSEDETRENVSEMYNWLAAAEFADSVGADVITSSLGYNKFDGGQGDYDYEDMDGNTTVVTRAADMAARKGMLVIVSAGNEGTSNWGKITAPADGDSVLAVGAVDGNGSYASFSSRGPTADGRIKPDVAAQGRSTAFLNYGGPTRGNGTSFSCPIVSGLATCLWQARPDATNMEIFRAIRLAADQSKTPDNELGYGIVNFRLALESLEESVPQGEVEVSIFPNPVGSEYKLEIGGLAQATNVVVTTYDLTGRRIKEEDVWVQNLVPVKLTSPDGIGSYILSVNTGEKVFVKKIFK